MRERVIKIIRSVVVLALAVSIAWALVKMKAKPQKQEPPPPSLLVEVIEVRASSPAMTIQSYGTVRPGETLTVVSEVRGKIVEISPTFEEGGFFGEGDLLIRIDPRSYELAVAQKEKQLKQVDAELRRIDQEKANLETTLKIGINDLELARADLERFEVLVKREVAAQVSLDQAKQNYLASKRRVQEIENQLALIEPRVHQLQVQRELLEVQLKDARLNLDRTKINAPFNGRVLEKRVERGQFINAGTPLGRIYNSSTLEVEVRIPFRDLTWIRKEHGIENPTQSEPAGFLSNTHIKARVIFKSSSHHKHVWEGHVSRIKAQVDEKTRTLPLVVEIPADSLKRQSHYPLTPGMFVNVELLGREVDNVYLLPRSALHPGNLVYISDDKRLALRSVEVIRRLDDSVYVSKGLKDGDLVVITPLTAPKEGITLRLREKLRYEKSSTKKGNRS